MHEFVRQFSPFICFGRTWRPSEPITVDGPGQRFCHGLWQTQNGLARVQVAGEQIQRPLAITILGGLSIATALTLFLTPAAYEICHRRLDKDYDGGSAP